MTVLTVSCINKRLMSRLSCSFYNKKGQAVPFFRVCLGFFRFCFKNQLPPWFLDVICFRSQQPCLVRFLVIFLEVKNLARFSPGKQMVSSKSSVGCLKALLPAAVCRIQSGSSEATRTDLSCGLVSV